MDDEVALAKKHGSTSDRPCSRTLNIPNLVSGTDIFLIPGGAKLTLSRGEPRALARQGSVARGFPDGVCWASGLKRISTGWGGGRGLLTLRDLLTAPIVHPAILVLT
jgi:hypothetical protein